MSVCVSVCVFVIDFLGATAKSLFWIHVFPGAMNVRPPV